MYEKLRQLSLSFVVYGIGDVATTLVGFVLLYFFTLVLSPDDYGVLALLLTVELVAKILFRWGVDASFMRLYYDCGDDAGRRRLASTIFWFLVAVNGSILAAALLASPLLARHLFGVTGHTLALRIVLVNTFIGSFYFIPFHVMRIEGQPAQFSVLTFSRSASTIVLRVVLVLGLHMGVLGMVLADLFVTLLFTPVLARWFAPLVRPLFSRDVLRDALRFGLPRVPHGVAQQVIGPGTDAYFLRTFLVEPPSVARGLIGVYSLGAGFGLALKLFLSAFETAWAPFYFATMKEEGAKKTFAAVTTYALAVLLFLSAGLSAVAPDLVRLVIRNQAFHAASSVIPWIAVAVTLQGVYLLTSIGLNITKRTEFYPVSTTLAAVANVAANAVLVPRYGFVAAAWSSVIAYGVLASTAFAFSQRLYPVRYEWGRLAKLSAAAVAAYVAASYPVVPFGPLAGVLARGLAVVVLFPLLLAVSGFFGASELARAREIVTRLRGRNDYQTAAAAGRAAEAGVAGMDANVVTGETTEQRASLG